MLEIISNHSTFDSKTKFTARTLLQNWSKFDVIMTAAIYLDIFSISSPISKFLQSPSLNYLTAFNMINNLHKKIRSRRDNADSIFINLYSKVKHFITEINKELELNSSNFTIKNDFNKGKSVGRVSKKKCLVKKQQMNGQIFHQLIGLKLKHLIIYMIFVQTAWINGL